MTTFSEDFALLMVSAELRRSRGGVVVTFPLNLLTTEEIAAELKRRKMAEVQALRDRVNEHRQAIRELEARLALFTKSIAKA